MRVRIWLLVTTLLLGGCTGIPERVRAVEGVDLERYLGRWYEVARLDHGFERGMTHVTADYSWREDGGIRVVNRGWQADKGEWKTAQGRAYPVERLDLGRLKVSFFGPFYCGYNIIELDADYRYALVAGPSRDYLWILSRTVRLPEGAQEALLAKAAALGFDVDTLIFVEQCSEAGGESTTPPCR